MLTWKPALFFTATPTSSRGFVLVDGFQRSSSKGLSPVTHSIGMRPRSTLSAIIWFHRNILKDKLYVGRCTTVPLIRTTLLALAWTVLPHRLTGDIQSWLGIRGHENLHECATSYCPFNRVHRPEARTRLEDTIALRCHQAHVNGDGSVHLMSFGVGGLFSEAILLNRLLEAYPALRIRVSLFTPSWKPMCALLSNDSETLGSEMSKGYNEELHEVTSWQIRDFQSIFLRSGSRLEIRCYGDKQQLIEDVKNSEIERVDVLAVMDPGLEPFTTNPAVASAIDLFKTVSSNQARFILGWVEKGQPVVRDLDKEGATALEEELKKRKDGMSLGLLMSALLGPMNA